jgi:hypothetical protein
MKIIEILKNKSCIIINETIKIIFMEMALLKFYVEIYYAK